MYRFVHVLVPPNRAEFNFQHAASSESHWDGKSDEPASSAGVQLSDAGSCVSGFPGPGTLADHRGYQVSLREPLIASWLANTSNSLDADAPSIIPKGVKRLMPELSGRRLGDWLI